MYEHDFLLFYSYRPEPRHRLSDRWWRPPNIPKLNILKSLSSCETIL